MMNLSQQYKKLVEDLISDIDKIDKETPWEGTEPEWWVQMMILRRSAQERLDRIENIIN